MTDPNAVGTAPDNTLATTTASVLSGAVPSAFGSDGDVPPPVAAKAGFAPVASVRPPSKRIVAPVFAVSAMPEPSPSPPSVMLPLKSFVPPLVLRRATSCRRRR